MCFPSSNHTKMVGPVNCLFQKKVLKWYFLSGIHGTAPIDLIKIFDENELEVCKHFT